MSLHFRRALLFSSFPIEGKFKFSDEFQILPPDDKFPKLSWLDCHQPFILEYKFESPDLESVNQDDPPQFVIDNEYAANKITEITLLLSVFSENFFFYYKSEKSWFHSFNEENDNTIYWGQQGYFIREFNDRINSLSKINIHEISLIEPNSHFNRIGHYVDHKLDLPSNIHDSFRAYFGLPKETQDIFLSSTSLLHQGIDLWGTHPSLSFASIISSLETLIAYEYRLDVPQPCECCGQKNFYVAKKFRDFIRKYGSKDNEFRQFAIKIYDLRSKILHRGELFLGETKSIPFKSLEHIYTDDMRRGVIRLSRICLNNWLFSQYSVA